MKTAALLIVSAAVFGLSMPAGAQEVVNPQDGFFKNLTMLCGQRFEGKVVTTDAADADFAANAC